MSDCLSAATKARFLDQLADVRERAAGGSLRIVGRAPAPPEADALLAWARRLSGLTLVLRAGFIYLDEGPQ